MCQKSTVYGKVRVNIPKNHKHLVGLRKVEFMLFQTKLDWDQIVLSFRANYYFHSNRLQIYSSNFFFAFSFVSSFFQDSRKVEFVLFQTKLEGPNRSAIPRKYFS